MAIIPNQDLVHTDVPIVRSRNHYTLIGVLIALVLGFGLVWLVLYGRILTDDAAVVSTPPAAVTAPIAPAPTPTAPTPNTP